MESRCCWSLGLCLVLLLQVGEHSLEVQAPGRIPHKRTLQVRGGEHALLRVTLDSLGPSAALHTDTRPTETSAPTPVYKKWWLWTTVAVVAVAGATTAALLLTRDDKTNTDAIEGTDTAGVSLQTWRRF